jgi:hypothetical protein
LGETQSSDNDQVTSALRLIADLFLASTDFSRGRFTVCAAALPAFEAHDVSQGDERQCRKTVVYSITAN